MLGGGADVMALSEEGCWHMEVPCKVDMLRKVSFHPWRKPLSWDLPVLELLPPLWDGKGGNTTG